MNPDPAHDARHCARPRVLIVAHEFPPIGGIGVQRPYKFATYLPDFGWEPVVLTQTARYSPTWDPSLLSGLGDVRVWRAPDPFHLLQAWLHARQQTAAHAAARSGGVSAGSQPAGGRTNRLRGALKGLQAAFFLPDNAAWWLPYAQRLGRTRLEDEPVDAIYATSPPHTSLLVAALLADAFGVPLVADFRDPWVSNLHRGEDSGLRRRLDRSLEAFVVETAAIILTVTDSFRRDFCERYPAFADKLRVIPNGYDARDLYGVADRRTQTGAAHSAAGLPPAQDRRFTIYYGGILYEKRSPELFLRGLALALDDGLPRERLAARFAGVFDYPGKDAHAALVRELGLSDVVHILGYVPHARHVELMKEADVLLLVGDKTPAASAYVPAKLYEYLGAGKPVLALVQPGEASRLVEECEAGFVLPLSQSGPEEESDIQRTAGIITQVFRRWEAGDFRSWSPSPLAKQYERREQARLLADLLNGLTNG